MDYDEETKQGKYMFDEAAKAAAVDATTSKSCGWGMEIFRSRSPRLINAMKVLRACWVTAGAALLTEAWVAHQWQPMPRSADERRMEALHARCIADMVAQTCSVMSATTSTSGVRTIASGGVVFIAGSSPVDAALYVELQSAGDEMGQTVRRHCTKNWWGGRCAAARALYGS